MKTTFYIFISMLVMFSSMQAFACPLKGETTGGACSVKDIQNLEKERMQEQSEFNLKGKKNLRPVKVNPEIKNPDEASCIFCLQKAVFGK